MTALNKMLHFIVILVLISVDSSFCDLPEGSIKFILYNKHYPNGQEIQDMAPSNITIYSNTPTKVFYHGVLSNSTERWDLASTEVYLEHGYNFLAVDWNRYAYVYFIPLILLEDMSKLIGNFFISLYQEEKISFDDVHMIGYSIGAHLAGEVGKYIYRTTNKKIGRVTGLDPPDFAMDSLFKEKRLSENDATFVDVIHASAISITALGHADFYPNGWSFENNTYYGHVLIMDLYAESIMTNNFIATKCDSYHEYLDGSCANNVQAVMGDNCDPSVSGIFYLTTNHELPTGTD